DGMMSAETAMAQIDYALERALRR
ncbi:MAG: hypothetical protein QOD30_2035, partial [Actinomycetota bacterium]|nr:hypothetical protein [Actinomycetota bacterium]